jgi:hypothetical protein
LRIHPTTAFPPFDSPKICPAPSSGNDASAECGVKPRVGVDHTSFKSVVYTRHSHCQSQQEDVMAAHSAVRAINSQEITDKARRDLLHLLEGVCKAYEDQYCQAQRLTDFRSEARRTLSLKRRSPGQSASLSNSVRSRNMVSTRFSS